MERKKNKVSIKSLFRNIGDEEPTPMNIPSTYWVEKLDDKIFGPKMYRLIYIGDFKEFLSDNNKFIKMARMNGEVTEIRSKFIDKPIIEMRISTKNAKELIRLQKHLKSRYDKMLTSIEYRDLFNTKGKKKPSWIPKKRQENIKAYFLKYDSCINNNIDPWSMYALYLGRERNIELSIIDAMIKRYSIIIK